MSEVKINYRIAGIDEFQDLNGYVAVYMEPVNKLNVNNIQKENLKVQGFGPSGTPIPQEVLQQLSAQVEKMLPSHLRKEKEDPRIFVHVEPTIDFIPRGWKFGDIIEVSMKKVKDASEIDPMEK